jgi:hypothetical protein
MALPPREQARAARHGIYRSLYEENTMLIKRTLLVAGFLCVSLHQAIAADSGFIDNMPQLLQDTDRGGAMIWIKPDVNRAAYTKVMIEPITIFISPSSEYKDIDANELKALADGFTETLIKTLEPEIAVLNKAGPGIAYMRAALTNVKLAQKKRGLLGYTPIGLVATAVADAAGARISLKDVVLEVEVLDSLTGERLGVLVDKAPTAAGSDSLSWDSINRTFAFYAERFKARMLAAK